ncbi:hypothetical protein ABVK40_05940 [Lonsdalea quercina]
MLFLRLLKHLTNRGCRVGIKKPGIDREYHDFIDTLRQTAQGFQRTTYPYRFKRGDQCVRFQVSHSYLSNYRKNVTLQ